MDFLQGQKAEFQGPKDSQVFLLSVTVLPTLGFVVYLGCLRLNRRWSLTTASKLLSWGVIEFIWALHFFLTNNQQIHKLVAMIYRERPPIPECSGFESGKQPGEQGLRKQERFNKHVTVHPLIFWLV